MNELRIKQKLFVHVIIAVLVIALMLFTYWGLFLREDAEEPDQTAYIIVAVMLGVGALILFFITRILITQSDVIYINEKGFEYNPGGISSGFINWDDVQEIKKVNVKTVQGNLNGPVLETAIAIKLKDPSSYRLYSSPLLKPLLNLNKSMYAADLFIRISDLGTRVKEAEELLSRYGNNGKALEILNVENNS